MIQLKFCPARQRTPHVRPLLALLVLALSSAACTGSIANATDPGAESDTVHAPVPWADDAQEPDGVAPEAELPREEEPANAPVNAPADGTTTTVPNDARDRPHDEAEIDPDTSEAPDANSDAAPLDAYQNADLSELNVESGDVSVLGATLALRSAVVRAVLGHQHRAGLELSFTHRGVSAEPAPLASGELRQQIGIKLRAKDTCNLVYAMWHIAPSTGIHVSVKANPGQSEHAQCGDGGYTQVTPSFTREVAPIRNGERRTLDAKIEGTRLTVTIDGVAVWKGTLPSTAFAFDGPLGFRSDNGDFDANLRIRP